MPPGGRITFEHPAEWLLLHAIPSLDEPANCERQCLDIIVRGVPQHSAMEDGEEQLDLVHPGRVDRRVVEMEPTPVAPIESSPALHGTVKMDVQVVPDHMNLLTR